jgi:nucleotide-binding universal stress UspA family protein
MFKRLLVPLDGSKLAEAALPVAASLAQGLQVSVTLLHIVEKDPPRAVHGDAHLTNPDEALAYLEEVARRAFAPGIVVERHVHTAQVGDVARSIVDHGQELAPELVVMCTHGRGGLRGLLVGSIAQQVVGQGAIPVLLIPAAASWRPGSFVCRRLLVALEGSSAHDEALQPAAELARALQATLHLLVVVPTLSTLAWDQAAPGKLAPGTMSTLLELEAQRAEDHIRQHEEALRAQGVQVTVEVRRGDPSAAIVKAARRAEADLIVMGTHGRRGVDAIWAGSVTPKVSARSHLPLLLVPIPEPLEPLQGDEKPPRPE